MVFRYFPIGALAFALCLGCNSDQPSEPTAEHSHDDHAHEAGEHAHDHAGHNHAGHEHGDHEHGAHGDTSKTYAEAVEKVEAARDAIRDSLAAGEKDKADAALHEVGHVLERIPELAKESLPEAEQADVKKDVEEIFDLFGKLDEQIHGGAEITYDTFADKIDAVVERLHVRTEKKE